MPPQFVCGVTVARGLVVTFDPRANRANVRVVDPETDENGYSELLTQD